MMKKEEEFIEKKEKEQKHENRPHETTKTTTHI